MGLRVLKGMLFPAPLGRHACAGWCLGLLQEGSNPASFCPILSCGHWLMHYHVLEVGTGVQVWGLRLGHYEIWKYCQSTSRVQA